MQQWWWAIVPAMLGGVGYALRRWIERRRRSEGLRRKLQALALHQGLTRSGLSLDELEQLERRASR